MYTTPILQLLKNSGQQLDKDIAAATGISLPKVRRSLSELSHSTTRPACFSINRATRSETDRANSALNSMMNKPASNDKGPSR